jgi:gliding motility-associatede transport system auxiliary component
VKVRHLRFDSHPMTELAGVVAAVVLAVTANVLAARHFTRWDWTANKRWTLSPATLETLHTLEQTVDIWAFAGPGDPLEPSLRELLASYTSASSRTEVHWIDPDRDAVQLVDLQRRFGLEAGQAEDGRVATDAIVIVASRNKHWFLTPSDMYEQSDDVHVKPREERALTQAIRSVLGGEKVKLCFTVGHGELTLEPGKDEREWLGHLRDLLQKSNYELATIDTTAPNDHEPFAGCSVAVVPGPVAPFSPDEENRLRTWLLQGGSLFAAVGPVDSSARTGPVGTGLEEALSPFGIAIDDDVVQEIDPAAAIPETHAEGFIASVRTHPVTASLVIGGTDAHPPRVAIFFARSLRHVAAPGAAWAADLLGTTGNAYAKTSVAGAATWTDAPPREASDPAGPFVVAMASERPRIGTPAPHGPRVVVVGSRFILAEDNWRQPRAMHGAAFLVDSAISWLAAKTAVVDVPDRGEVSAGVLVSERGREEVRRYVLMLMPLAALLLGGAVWGWRKSTEDKPYARGGK